MQYVILWVFRSVECFGSSTISQLHKCFFMAEYYSIVWMDPFGLFLSEVFFFFFGHAHSMWKFQGQGSNPCHSGHLSQSSDTTRSLAHWATRELYLVTFEVLQLQVFCLCFCFLWLHPAAYRSSQARGQIGAAAAGLHHSHGNARSEPHLQCSPQPATMQDF